MTLSQNATGQGHFSSDCLTFKTGNIIQTAKSTRCSLKLDLHRKVFNSCWMVLRDGTVQSDAEKIWHNWKYAVTKVDQWVGGTSLGVIQVSRCYSIPQSTSCTFTTADCYCQWMPLKGLQQLHHDDRWHLARQAPHYVTASMDWHWQVDGTVTLVWLSASSYHSEGTNSVFMTLASDDTARPTNRYLLCANDAVRLWLIQCFLSNEQFVSYDRQTCNSHHKVPAALTPLVATTFFYSISTSSFY